MTKNRADSGRRSIGDLAAMTGTKIPTIRYYESIGLMPEPARSAGNQRAYGDRHATRLAFIRHARELGFALDAIRELLALSDDPDRSCFDADRIAKEQLVAVQRRIVRLKALETELERMLGDCRHGSIRECRVIEVLGDHSLCGHLHAEPEDPTAAL
ncbi:MerR family transcriptional regulator [Hansschlegelia plantiphila]|uniref:MerR family transcriptional regulator n=1 Tax=Hansschlegelia plantiphila TaxID=374655 RepID=A0A9W6MUX0_9HYPH|nr:helix-turn-helix domain-containing protein [Hansschlegelia plantiphila]GLK67333.1 MerR family transcriptional regulator [Hansschlegelia plantiphila]